MLVDPKSQRCTSHYIKMECLKVCLQGMQNEYLKKGGCVNTICEQYFSICRALGLRLGARYVISFLASLGVVGWLTKCEP